MIKFFYFLVLIGAVFIAATFFVTPPDISNSEMIQLKTDRWLGRKVK